MRELSNKSTWQSTQLVILLPKETPAYTGPSSQLALRTGRLFFMLLNKILQNTLFLLDGERETLCTNAFLERTIANRGPHSITYHFITATSVIGYNTHVDHISC